jgi:uncharacterized membrane protein
MGDLFKEVASKIVLGVEVVAVLIVAYGASEAFGTPKTHGRGLEFELAADIVRSVISPTWFEIGQLAAIAVIRTFLKLLPGERRREVCGAKTRNGDTNVSQKAAGATR